MFRAVATGQSAAGTPADASWIQRRFGMAGMAAISGKPNATVA